MGKDFRKEADAKVQWPPRMWVAELEWRIKKLGHQSVARVTCES